MRISSLSGSVTLVVMFGVAHAGCSNDAEDCELNPKLECGPYATTSTGGGGQGGQGGGTPSECIPSEANGPVDISCGVFVSSSLGDDGNTGSKDEPFATITAAVDSGAGAIYVCAESFTEAVVLPSGVSLFGGLDCANGWPHSGDKAQLTAAPDAVPLTLSPGAGTTRVEDFAVTAQAATVPGGHAVALFANQAEATLSRCDLVAGAGALGADGDDGAVLDDDPNNDGSMGAPGTTMPVGACNAQLHTGGAGGPKTCDGVVVTGGNGGSASTDPGGQGQEGQPNNAGPEGNGGAGQNVAGATQCTAGTQGAQGMAGENGTSGAAAGELTSAGFTAASGSAGQGGEHGQGGGGGGASGCTSGNTGPSGGGGGSGGCAGKGGAGGTAGGSSFALLSHDAALTLVSCTLQAGAGANGGAGGDGQMGGFGGLGGPPGGGGACPGGIGGNGGNGGHGGGGRGGHTAAVGFTGEAPVLDAQSSASASSAGNGGLGGGGVAALAGAAGLSCASLSFDTGDCVAAR